MIKLTKIKKKKLLKPYQVNKKIMKVANKDSIFMHCLPASRGEEVTNERLWMESNQQYG